MERAFLDCPASKLSLFYGPFKPEFNLASYKMLLIPLYCLVIYCTALSYGLIPSFFYLTKLNCPTFFCLHNLNCFKKLSCTSGCQEKCAALLPLIIFIINMSSARGAEACKQDNSSSMNEWPVIATRKRGLHRAVACETPASFATYLQPSHPILNPGEPSLSEPKKGGRRSSSSKEEEPKQSLCPCQKIGHANFEEWNLFMTIHLYSVLGGASSHSELNQNGDVIFSFPTLSSPTLPD